MHILQKLQRVPSSSYICNVREMHVPCIISLWVQIIIPATVLHVHVHTLQNHLFTTCILSQCHHSYMYST